MNKIVVLAVVGSIALVVTGCGPQPKQGTAAVATRPSVESTAPASRIVRNDVATLAKYNKIKRGMTYDRVASIMGSRGVLNSGAGGGKNHVQVFYWLAPDDVSTMNVTFAKGRVIGKTGSLSK